MSEILRLMTVSEQQQRGLAELLVDCVEGGASVGFMRPLSVDRAAAFWSNVAQAVERGQRALWLARSDGRIVGTVQLILDMPENQPHRADVSKMLVRREARRQGLGAALLRAAEAGASDAGKSLLVLDTANGEAGRLYSRLGWQRVGVIPGFALWPGGGLCDTMYFYRQLG